MAVFILTACGTSADKSEPNSTESVTPSPSATVDEDRDFAPEAIASFTCRADSQGGWLVLGELKNPRAAKATFRVTVFLGSGEGTGHSLEVGPLGPGKKQEFNFGVLKHDDPKATCRVQAEVLER